MEKMEQDEDLYKDETAFRELEAIYARMRTLPHLRQCHLHFTSPLSNVFMDDDLLKDGESSIYGLCSSSLELLCLLTDGEG